MFLLLFWVLVPILGSLPYIALGTSNSFISAYFESVSAFTTTGASSLIADDLSQVIILWRSILQWFGGVCAATFAIVILAALNLFGTGIHKSKLFTLEKGKLFLKIININIINTKENINTNENQNPSIKIVENSNAVEENSKSRLIPEKMMWSLKCLATAFNLQFIIYFDCTLSLYHAENF